MQKEPLIELLIDSGFDAETTPVSTFPDSVDSACIGYVSRIGDPDALAYDYDLLIEAYMKKDGMTDLEAIEHINHNVAGGRFSKNDPFIFYKLLR